MKNRLVSVLIGLMLLGGLSPSWAAQQDCIANVSAPTTTENKSAPCSQDLNGNIRTTLGTLLSGEDTVNNVIRVENQFSRGISTGADVAIKSGAGLLHSVTCFSDAAATAGDLAIRDSVSAGAGTIIMQNWYTAVAVSSSTQVVDIPFTTGLYADYTTTNDVTCVFTYR